MRESMGRRCTAMMSVLLMLGVFASGCSDDLNESSALTRSFPRTDIIIRDTTIAATSSGSFLQRIGTNGRNNQLGRFGDYTSYTLIQFYQSLFPHRDTVVVLSATLTLRAVTWFGDSSSAFGFTVHSISQAWDEPSVRWDSLPTYDPEVRGTFSGGINADTMQVVVSLDTAMVRQWLLPRTVTQHGIILIPTPGTNVIRGFHCFNYDSVSFYPKLEIIARNISGIVQDTASFTFGIDSYTSNVNLPVSNPNLLFVQSGVVYRSRLNFDVGFIPRGAIVNSAELVLTRDPATSRLTRFTGDTLVVGHVLTSATDSSRFEGQGTVGRPTEVDPLSFSFDLRHAVQVWVAGTNYGLLVRASNISEFGSLDLYTFFSHVAPDPAQRPRLRIKYAVENQ